jgi:hypothetical protein
VNISPLGRTSLDPRWTIVPVGGLDKIPTFIALLGAHLPNVTVLLDVAAGGSQKIDSLVERGVIASDKLIPLTQITGSEEADIEDLFDLDFYLELLAESGTATVTKAKLKKGKRIVKRVEATIGHPYDHYKPARYLLEKQVDLLSKIDTGTFDRFDKLFEAANERLS